MSADEANKNEMMNELYAQFPQEMERVRMVGGVELAYLPISEVINRLNRVLGVDGWSFTIVSVGRDTIEPDEVIAHVCLTAEINGKTVVKHGLGGQSIKKAKSTGKPIDVGNDFKGAVSDALKKAAQQLGIGLYLARTADALEAEDAMLSGPAEAPVQAVSSEVDEAWSRFMDMAKGLNPEQRSSLNEFWSSYSGGKPKPTKASASIDDINALIEQVVKIQFSATDA